MTLIGEWLLPVIISIHKPLIIFSLFSWGEVFEWLGEHLASSQGQPTSHIHTSFLHGKYPVSFSQKQNWNNKAQAEYALYRFSSLIECWLFPCYFMHLKSPTKILCQIEKYFNSAFSVDREDLKKAWVNPISFLGPIKYNKTFVAYAIEIEDSSISNWKGGNNCSRLLWALQH